MIAPQLRLRLRRAEKVVITSVLRQATDRSRDHWGAIAIPATDNLQFSDQAYTGRLWSLPAFDHVDREALALGQVCG
jgi:hypothetical protein